MDTLKIYDHGHCKTIAINGLTKKQYREAYTYACNNYTNVIQRCDQSLASGKLYGYIKVYNQGEINPPYLKSVLTKYKE